MQKSKILIIDCLDQIPFGKHLFESFSKLGLVGRYLYINEFKKKSFYKLRRCVKKLFSREKKYFYYAKGSSENFKKLINEFCPQYVLVVGTCYKFIDPAVLENLKIKNQFKLIMWDTDIANMFANFPMLKFFLKQEAKIYDQIFSFSKITCNFLQNTGYSETKFLPYGAKKIDASLVNKQITHKNTDICFIGAPWSSMRRALVLENLRDYNLKVYGIKWKNILSLVSSQLKNKIICHNIWGDNLYNAIQQTKIILNITDHQMFGAETGINLRIFEILSCAGFLLTDYCDELNDLFVIGKEIEVYKSSAELIDKVNFYLKNDDARSRIALAGHQRFLKDYTLDCRAKKFIKLAGIDIN